MASTEKTRANGRRVSELNDRKAEENTSALIDKLRKARERMMKEGYTIEQHREEFNKICPGLGDKRVNWGCGWRQKESGIRVVPDDVLLSEDDG